MPTFTLSIALLYSAYFILSDCLRRRSVSIAVWVPTILMMILGSRPLSLWLNGGTVHLGVQMANDQANSAVDQIFFFVVLLTSLFIASYRGFKWGTLVKANYAIILFYLYFAISISWSSDPVGSTKRLGKDFGLILVGAVILSEEDPFQSMRAVFVRSAALLLPLSIVFIKYFPQYGRAYGIGGEVMLTGATTQKNSLGEIVLLFTLFMVWDYLETRPPGTKLLQYKFQWNLIFLISLGLWLLQISQSKTALVCTVTGVFLIIRSDRFAAKFVNWLVLGGTLFLPFFVFFMQKFSSVVAPIIEALGRNMTFTGRTDIWEHITATTVNPIIGYGYWNFWGGPGGYAVNQAMHSIIPNAHNGYVDLYLDGGILGLSVLTVMLVSCGRKLIKYIKLRDSLNRYHRVRFAVLIAAIIYNLSESTFARLGPIWFTTLLMIVDYPPLIRAAKAARESLKRKRSIATFTSPVFCK